jgi:hypothetical protein
MDQAQIRRLIEGLQVLTGERGASGRRALRVDEFDKMFGPASVQTRQQIAQLAEQAAQQGAELGSIVGQIVTINQDIENTIEYVDNEVALALSTARSEFQAADVAISNQISAVQVEFAAESVSLVRDRLLNLQDSANWTRDQGQGALTIVNNDVFGAGKTWRFTVALGQQDGLFTRSDRATWRGIRNSDAFRVEVDFTLQSGTLAGAGVAVDWQNDASTVFRRAIPLSDMLAGPVVAGQPARATAIFRRPTGFSGAFDHTTLRAWANNAAIGDGAKEIRFHRISIWPANADEALVAETAAAVVQEAIARADGDGALAAQITTVSSNVGSLTATVSSQAAALTTLEGYAAATLAFRAQAGSGGATLELVASNNPSGPASAARIDAQNIILNGSVTATQLATAELITLSAQIANGIITNAKIADATIQSAKIQDAAITSAKIGDLQVNTAKIADLSVETLKIGNNAVTVTRSASSSGSTSSGAFTTLASLTFTPSIADGALGIWAKFRASATNPEDQAVLAKLEARLMWRGSQVGTTFPISLFVSGSSITTISTDHVDIGTVAGGSGAGTLELQARVVSLTSGGSASVSNPILICSEFKK